VTSFIIYYDDGSEFALIGDAPRTVVTAADAPGQGVLVVAQTDPDVGRELLHMKDFYCWDHGRWIGVDTYGLYDYLARPGWKKVVAGRTVAHSVYSSTFGRASTDQRLPQKTARLAGEEPKR
jgi:hypothetical protein